MSPQVKTDLLIGICISLAAGSAFGLTWLLLFPPKDDE